MIREFHGAGHKGGSILKRKWVLTLLVVVLFCAGAYGLRQYFALQEYRQAVNAITISAVDLTTIPDGIYIGSYNALWVAAEVKATVKDHKIVALDLLQHKQERGKPAEVILNQVLQKQSLQIDSISGATSSSKVILKALETALKSGQK
jgi:uncharacterized protein with FMN-binding domain